MANDTDTDPIDAMDLSDVVAQADSTETTVPDDLVLKSEADGADADDEGDAAETPEEAAARARDEKTGRFTKKDDDPAAAAAAKAADPAAAAAAGKPATPTPAPFQYRAMGANHALEGAHLDEQGNLTIAAEQVGKVRQALNALHMAEEGTIPVIQERDHKISELASQNESLRALGQSAEAVISFVESIVKNPDDEKALAEFWRLRTGGWDVHMAAAENKYLQSQLARAQAQPNRADAATREQASAAEQAGMPDVDVAQATTVEFLEQAKLDNRFRGLTADDWTQLETRLSRTPYAFLRKATAEEARQYGPIVFDIPAFIAEVQDFQTSLTRQRDTASKRTKLAAENARRTQASITAPPTPGGGRQAVGAGAKKAAFTSAQEVDAWLDSDEL